MTSKQKKSSRRNLPKNRRPVTGKVVKKVASLSLALSMLSMGLANEVIAFKNGNIIIEHNTANADTVTPSMMKLKTLITPSVKTLSIPELEDEKVKTVNVDDLGAIPNDDKDDSQAIQKALDMSLNEPIHIKFSKDGKYIIDNPNKVNTEVIGSKGVYLEGENSTLMPKNHLTNPPEFYALQFHMKRGDNIGVKIKGINVDGSLNPQNQHYTMGDKLESYGGDASGFYKTAMVKGFRISHAEDISMSDSKFEHMYGGYVIMADGHRHVNIQDIYINDVGGDDITDSFGMFYYFGGHTFDDTVVNIDRSVAYGKVGDEEQYNPGTGRKNPGDKSYLSWIGVVDENGTIQSDKKENWLEDKNTTFNITNSEFYDIETTFHTESKAGNTYFNVDNIKTRAKDYFIYAGINGEHKTVSNRVDAELLAWGRNNLVKGILYSEKEDVDNKSGLNTNLITNSTFNYPWLEPTPHAPGSKDMLMATNYGNSVQGTYECDTFNGIPDGLVANAGADFIDSAINLHANNPRDQKVGELTIDDVKGYPEGNSVTAKNTSINHSNAWKTVEPCENPQFVGPNGYVPDELEKPVDPADVGGDNTPNIAPVINVSDVEILEGTEFDPRSGVTVTDDRDVNIAFDVQGTVDVNKPGEYVLKYTAKDSEDAVTVTERKVVVLPKESQPTTEEPTTEKPTTEKPTTEEPTTEKPTTEEPTTEKPTTEKPTTEEPTTEKPTTEKPTTEEPTTEKPTTEEPTTEKPTTEKPTTEKPTTEEPTTEKPTTEEPTTEEPPIEKPEVTNQAPMIFANDQIVIEGAEFNPLSGVEAYDHEDGELTKELKLIKGHVDTSKPGDYDLTYYVKDKDEAPTTTTITVTVIKDWSKDVTELEKTIESLNDKVISLESSSIKDKEEINELKKEISLLKEEVSKAKENYDVLKNDSLEMKKQIKDIVEKYNSVQMKLEELLNKISTSDENKSKPEDIETLKNKITELEDQLKDISEKMKTNNGGIVINTTNINTNINDKTSTETKSDSNSDDAKSTNTNTNDSDDKATAEEPIRTDDKSDEDKAATATPSKDESDKSDDNATKEEVTTEAPEKDGEQNNETKDKSVESAAQKTDESATEIVSTQQSPKTETQQTQAQSTGILPDTGSAWSNLLTYGGASLLLLGIALYMRFERKTKEN